MALSTLTLKTILLQNGVHASWIPIVEQALTLLPPQYLADLSQVAWLPGPERFLSAFSLPISQVRYVLWGESPYPRSESANGYAFWDAKVTGLWSEKGLSSAVNRATSLRNFIKMLLVAEGALAHPNTRSTDIVRINKNKYVDNLSDLFNNLLSSGALLLNASLVLQDQPVQKDVIVWRPFMEAILMALVQQKSAISLLLFGRWAQTLQPSKTSSPMQIISAEHPYNLSFIHNTAVINFFRPLQLLLKHRVTRS